MPGPAPKQPGQRRRRNIPAGGEWQELPREGRKGKPPVWPLGACSAEMDKHWRRLWRTPQATKWQDVKGSDLMVARYVTLTMELYDLGAMRVSAQIAAFPELRLLEDGLGLSPKGMQQLRWQLAPDEPVAVEEPSGVATMAAYRARLAGTG